MKVLHILLLAWEYPPMLVGGLGRHVYELSRAIAAKGHVIHVITTHIDDSQRYELVNDVHVHRVEDQYKNREDFYLWIQGLNEAMIRYGEVLCEEIRFDLIHAHDWLVCDAAKQLKHQEKIPIVTTIHATEHGRNNGIHTSLQYEIHMKEKELVAASEVLIVCSTYMKQEIEAILEAPSQKITVLPNGIDINFFQLGAHCRVRDTYCLQQRSIVFSIGRIVSEKGFHIVIDAAENLMKQYPQLIFIIAGRGPMLEQYRAVVVERGLEQAVAFVGHISEEEQRAFLQECDIVLVPSLYEPFGIVALEGMLAAKPTVVSEVGGLREIIRHGENGFTIQPGNVQSLMQQIKELLNNSDMAAKIAENGQNDVKQTYNWSNIATQTICLYTEAIHHSKSGG